MKLILSALIFLPGFSLVAQNDSVFPNLTAHYRIEILTIDHITFEYEYGYEDLYIVNNDPLEDTLSVMSNGLEVATIVTVANQVWIRRTANDYIASFGFRQEFGTGYELLYDFDLEVGDVAYWQYSPGDPAYVVSISWMDVQGVQRKKLNLSNGEAWIQGIGSTYHPLTAQLYYFENGYTLCSADLHYEGPSTVDSLLYQTACAFVGLDEQMSSPVITLFPNPANGDFLYMKTEAAVSEAVLTDLAGSRLDLAYDAPAASLNIAGVPAGMYLLQLTTNGGTVVKKIIITD